MSEERKFLRFPLAYRIEHWVLVLAFTVLAITGLAQKFAEAEISKALIGLLGGIEPTRIIHRTAAIILMLEVVYHLGATIYKLYVKRYQPSILPTMEDVRNAGQAILYNLRIGKKLPQQGRYTFEEKLEYWAVVWGTVIMVITGFMLWNPIATSRFLPGQFIPAAKTAHGGEALLAVLAIIVWHMYHVHIRSFNKSMFNGHLTEQEMVDEHPLELADVKAGVAERALNPQKLAKRRRNFTIFYGVLGSLLLVGIYFFITFEQTAITTIKPAEQVVVFAPLTPTPLPTTLPTPTQQAILETANWETGIGELFAQKCGACHVASKLGNLDLSSYASALEGGETGPGIVPGDPEASQVFIKQTAGNHPGQFSAQDLDLIQKWIETGAPEK